MKCELETISYNNIATLALNRITCIMNMVMKLAICVYDMARSAITPVMCVHTSRPEGDGIFEARERNYHLENGVIAIANYYKEKQNV